MTLDFLLSILLGYLLGSIPSAYLMVRWKSRKDIRQTGSGNVGALNSYLVTSSRLVGGTVLLLDMLKGMAAATLPRLFFDAGLVGGAAAGVASIIGHNFPVWLKFKGGRGLSTAAGVALVLAWPIVPVWCLLWALGFLLTRNVNVANALATVLLILGALVIPSGLLEGIVAGAPPPDGARLFFVLAFGVILMKHIAPVRAYVREGRGGAGYAKAEAEAEKENS
jgi:glycerol-3-phosphate acyltransferase PlsY